MNDQQPLYTNTWNVDVVLDYLRTLHPVTNLPLKFLTFKLNVLLALVLAQRAQTLVSLNTTFMTTTPDCVKFVVAAILKTSKPNKDLVEVLLSHFPACYSLCVYTTIVGYLKQTKSLCEPAGTSRLLLSYVKPCCLISTDTCAHWLQTVLSLSAVDINIFKAHSFRNAASSKAISQGVSVDLILTTADWSSLEYFFSLLQEGHNTE